MKWRKQSEIKRKQTKEREEQWNERKWNGLKQEIIGTTETIKMNGNMITKKWKEKEWKETMWNEEIYETKSNEIEWLEIKRNDPKNRTETKGNSM